MLKRLMLLSGTWISLAATASQDAPPELLGLDFIAARQASLDMSSIAFRSTVNAMKAGREAKSQSYSAAALAKWAKVLPRMFPPGTGEGETSASTQALTVIWRDRPGFDRAAANYATATDRLAALADANDTAGFTKQLEEVDQACRACHDRYKKGDKR
jgi:cytochrome c556